MTLYKQDFDKLAAMVRIYTDVGSIRRVNLASDLSDLCEDHNPSFDRDRFMAACDVVE